MKNNSEKYFLLTNSADEYLMLYNDRLCRFSIDILLLFCYSIWHMQFFVEKHIFLITWKNEEDYDEKFLSLF